jgi:hypothetical protein
MLAKCSMFDNPYFINESYSMKKISLLLIIILLQFAPQAAFAYNNYYNSFILFSSGLSSFEVGTGPSGEGVIKPLVIQGQNVSDLKPQSAEIYSRDKNKIVLIPEDYRSNDVGTYKFWNLIGTYQGKNFSVFGITLEGEWQHNNLVRDIIFILVGIVISIIAIKIGLKKAFAKRKEYLPTSSVP